MYILLDTDIDTDCDDVGALALLHALQTRGTTTLLGVICSVPYPHCASCVWTINAAYGRSDIPIGLVRVSDWTTNLRYEPYRRQRERCTKPLYNEVVTRTMSGRIPSNIYQDPVRQYRDLLSRAPDGSTTICVIGTLTALAQLLDSPPDEVSNLTGRDLIARKVRTLVTMAEGFPPSGEDGFNWKMDLVAASKVIAEWPTDLVVSPLGRDVLTGSRLMATTSLDHPVTLAYRTYLGDTDADRPSWDQLAVLYAALGPSSLLTENWDVGLTLDHESGRHEWGTTENSARRGYVSTSAEPQVLAQHVEDLMIESILGACTRNDQQNPADDA